MSGHNCSATITLNPGVPQGCVLSPVLYSLFTHDYRPIMYGSKSIIKFADNTTVISLISDHDESDYREKDFQASNSWGPHLREPVLVNQHIQPGQEGPSVRLLFKDNEEEPAVC